MYRLVSVPTGTALLRDDGACIPADAGNADYQAYLLWVSAGNSATPPAPAAPPSTLAPLAFMARFTQPEHDAIFAAAAANNPALLSWLIQAAGAAYVDVTDPRTKAGLEALVAAGLLTAEREAAILTP